MAVSFYRGDSPVNEESSSGTLWFTQTKNRKSLISKVIEKFKDGGLVVTDGSNCLKRKKNP